MKISAYHKARGDKVEFASPILPYDRVYVSRVFGDEYTTDDRTCFNADEVIRGGTGYEIFIENGKEVYRKKENSDLPPEIEHVYPDYSLYPKYTQNTAYGFLTRGCPNNCPFCIVAKKEGMKTVEVAKLSEFWSGQKNIKLLDANLLACKSKKELLQQLIDSRAAVDFTQGLDARFITEDIAKMLGEIKIKCAHFAFDFMKNEKKILQGLKNYKEMCNSRDSQAVVYVLTNFNTTIEQDLYRVQKIRELGFMPDIRIYRKTTAPRVVRDLQRWCNNRILYRSCDFFDFIPRKDGKTIKELYFN
jgi:hypothetical protein